MLRWFVVGSLSFFVLASVACSSSNEPGASSSGSTGNGGNGGNGGSGESCGKAGRSGSTTGTCGTCSAGQYCETHSTSSGFDECRPGCVSDDNCGETERCVRCEGEEIGSCRSCSETKEEICGPTGPAECVRNTSYDGECEAPGKAFECPNTASEPEGQGTCVQSDVLGVFCCGGGLASKCERETQHDLPLCGGRKAFGCPPGEEPKGKCELAPNGMSYCCD